MNGTGGYRLTVTLPNGESWSKETLDNRLAYPADAPPLVADGLPNIVELTSGDDAAGTAVDKTKLRVLTATVQTELAQAEAEIRALPLDKSSQNLFLAQLYRQHEMWLAALDQLVPLAQTQQPHSATLWQQVGDLYMQVELYVQAEQSYNQALAAARANEDLHGQGAAQFGLARTARAFDETDQALEHLKAAEALYRQAGQIDLAEVVTKEQDKLKEE
jgi:tetratricopeptide (TPR) repeat protein